MERQLLVAMAFALGGSILTSANQGSKLDEQADVTALGMVSCCGVDLSIAGMVDREAFNVNVIADNNC